MPIAEPDDCETVRSMEREDLPAVLAIERACYEYPWSEQIFNDCLRAGYMGLVLEQRDCLNGFTMVSSAAGESHILNLCVAPAKRRSGRAKVLLEQAIASVMLRGAEVMFLEVRPSNRGAIELYDSCGFVEIGRRPDYYAARNGREDAIVMSRQLLLPGADQPMQ